MTWLAFALEGVLIGLDYALAKQIAHDDPVMASVWCDIDAATGLEWVGEARRRGWTPWPRWPPRPTRPKLKLV